MWHLQLWHHMHAGRLSRWPNASFWQIFLATCTRKHCIGRCRGCCAASSQLRGCRESAMHVHRSKRNADLWTHSRRPDRPDPDSDLGPTTADPPPTPKSRGPTRSVRPAKRQASAAASQFETFGSPGVDQAGGLITDRIMLYQYLPRVYCLFRASFLYNRAVSVPLPARIAVRASFPVSSFLFQEDQDDGNGFTSRRCRVHDPRRSDSARLGVSRRKTRPRHDHVPRSTHPCY